MSDKTLKENARYILREEYSIINGKKVGYKIYEKTKELGNIIPVLDSIKIFPISSENARIQAINYFNLLSENKNQ